MTSETSKQAGSAIEEAPAERPRRRSPGVRSASEVLSILRPRPMASEVVVPTGLWKTGWLPKPEGAAS